MINLIEPIPLSPEILEKCGFKKWGEESNYEKRTFQKQNITINCEPNSNSYYFIATLCHKKNINYLHQLQELYSELVGEELIYTS